VAAAEGRRVSRGEKAYDLTVDGLPVYIGEGLGSLEYKDAVDLSIVKRTAMGLPASREYITSLVPPPQKPGLERGNSLTSRASKNNPYICVHCNYKSTRCSNMITHLRKSHGDYHTDPRDGC